VPSTPPRDRPLPPGSARDAPDAPALATKEILPGVRANLATKVVEFDGIVPINCHDPRTPDVYLEVMVCTPDTKEHESLVMTKARASDVHAALLAIGLEPGSPGRWDFKDKEFIPVPPRGGAVEVRLAYKTADGKEVEVPATDGIVNASTKGPFIPASGDPGGGSEPAAASACWADRSDAARVTLLLDAGHGHALHDQVHPGQVRRVRVDRRRLLDPYLEAVFFQMWDEQVGGFDGLVAEPATAYDQSGLHISHHITFNAGFVAEWRWPARPRRSE